MIVSHAMSPGQGSIFAPSAFEAQIGKRLPFRVGDRVYEATVLAATVIAGGAQAELTLDVPGLETAVPVIADWEEG